MGTLGNLTLAVANRQNVYYYILFYEDNISAEPFEVNVKVCRLHINRFFTCDQSGLLFSDPMAIFAFF